MDVRNGDGHSRRLISVLLVAACSAALWGCNDSDNLVQSSPPPATVDLGPAPLTVPKAKCGPGDSPGPSGAL